MEIFNVSDLFVAAAKMEKRGEVLYSELASSQKDKKIADIFKTTALQEKKHGEKFRAIAKTFKQDINADKLSEEYSDLKDYVKNKSIFASDTGTKHVFKGLKSALEFVAKNEEESIIYYKRLGQFVDLNTSKAIDSIMDEEKKHFKIVEDLIKGLD